MKKMIISMLFALALGFIIGFYRRDYCIRKQIETKVQAIEKRDIIMGNDTIQNILYNKGNSWNKSNCYECIDFGPV